ncbi:TetR/AcrR family transcriptional regulator [Radiobacillus kanasensis]|uniref:TetR/AcrR family transcriptional regulator n=1 Tax=Radiobacillus kanasensis TaxID=2844358 RepID=UPI001E4C597D|nr:TetR/AcrR family transcriptional regulator C-terminal domain-containing protein [Radiobacillus kanasensis]UFT99559.1 TetR/AcrR family transcriptional regulator [Radiobacillus kanasensis]
METKTDRRILRTKKAINEAFLGLLTEKEFDRITINDISERANVNRGTFYLHYMDKYDLLDHSIDDHLNRMIFSCTFTKFTEEKLEKTEAIEALKSLFIYVEENFIFFSSMLSNKKTSAFRERMMALLSSGMQKKIQMQGINQNIDKELIVQFMTTAFVGTVESWILNNMPQPPQWMAEQIWTLFERNGCK